MTAAYILAINLVVAGLFAIAFAVVAATNPTAKGARWLALAYGLGVADVLLEFALPWLSRPTGAVVGIFLVYLAALTCGTVGVARHYRGTVPKAWIAAIWIGALASIPVMLALPYGTALRQALYQLPYASMQALMIVAVLRAPRRAGLDRLLLAVSGLATLSYCVKPLVALVSESASRPQDYLSSQYAAISQTMGSVVLIALALVLLLVMMRDMTIEMIARSETDSLSGLLNRRGFQSRGERVLAEAGRTRSAVTLAIVDIDRFKTINDTFGHPVGDQVIADMGRLLQAAVDEGDLVARLGGEEFAVLMVGKNLKEAYELAEDLRKAVSAQLPARLAHRKSVTASFGIAEWQPASQLSDLMRRSDFALYRAKAQGRNQVSMTSADPGTPSSQATRSAGRAAA